MSNSKTISLWPTRKKLHLGCQAWHHLQFEYADQQDVCLCPTDYAALAVAHEHYKKVMQDESSDYHDFCLQMFSILRHLPASLQSQTIAVRCKEEATRTKIATLLCNRPDLAAHYFVQNDFSADDAIAMVEHFIEGTVVPVESVRNPSLFANRPDAFKQAVANLINNISAEGILTPRITCSELELLLTDGNPELTYCCNNQAQFAHLLYMLARFEVLPKKNYLHRICQHNKLVAPMNSEGKSLPIYPKKLSALRGNALAQMDNYDVINRTIESILH